MICALHLNKKVNQIINRYSTTPSKPKRMEEGVVSIGGFLFKSSTWLRLQKINPWESQKSLERETRRFEYGASADAFLTYRELEQAKGWLENPEHEMALVDFKRIVNDRPKGSPYFFRDPFLYMTIMQRYEGNGILPFGLSPWFWNDIKNDVLEEDYTMIDGYVRNKTNGVSDYMQKAHILFPYGIPNWDDYKKRYVYSDASSHPTNDLLLISAILNDKKPSLRKNGVAEDFFGNLGISTKKVDEYKTAKMSFYNMKKNDELYQYRYSIAEFLYKVRHENLKNVIDWIYKKQKGLAKPRLTHGVRGEEIEHCLFAHLDELEDCDFGEGQFSSNTNPDIVFERASQRIKKRNENELKKNNFQFLPFPFKKMNGITFLKNSAQLGQEGNLMNHCVASYANKCRYSESVIFHVGEAAPNGATLEIVKEQGYSDSRYSYKARQLYAEYDSVPKPEVTLMAKEFCDLNNYEWQIGE